MGKLREFAKKHKMVLVSGATAVLGFVGGLVLDSVIGKKPKMDASHPLFIQPDYYKTFDEAVDAFKKKQETTKHAVLFDSFGQSYGVYDEAKLLGEE